MISYLEAFLQETSLTLHQVEVLLFYVLETSYICNHSPSLSKSINLEAKLFHLSRNFLLAPLHPLHIQIVNLFAWILSRHSVCLGQIFQALSFNTVAPESFSQGRLLKGDKKILSKSKLNGPSLKEGVIQNCPKAQRTFFWWNSCLDKLGTSYI